MQDYFNFQVHAHTVVPELLTFKVLVLLAQSYINFYKKNNTIHQNINSWMLSLLAILALLN